MPVFAQKSKGQSMKKSLLLAALLLPCAAQADIYFCATSIFTHMDLAFGIIVEEKKGLDINKNFVVDTDKGISRANRPTAVYEGSCLGPTPVMGDWMTEYHCTIAQGEGINGYGMPTSGLQSMYIEDFGEDHNGAAGFEHRAVFTFSYQIGGTESRNYIGVCTKS